MAVYKLNESVDRGYLDKLIEDFDFSNFSYNVSNPIGSKKEYQEKLFSNPTLNNCLELIIDFLADRTKWSSRPLSEEDKDYLRKNLIRSHPEIREYFDNYHPVTKERLELMDGMEKLFPFWDSEIDKLIMSIADKHGASEYDMDPEQGYWATVSTEDIKKAYNEVKSYADNFDEEEGFSKWIDVGDGYEIQEFIGGDCCIFLNSSQLSDGYADSYEEALEIIEKDKERRGLSKKKVSQWKLIRELDPDSERDKREAYREAGLYLDSSHRVGKYKDADGFIHYKYM